MRTTTSRSTIHNANQTRDALPVTRTSTNTQRHLRHHQYLLKQEEKNDNIAIIMVFILGAISSSAIFGVIIGGIALTDIALPWLVALSMVIGTMLIAAFKSCFEHIESRIKKRK